MDCLIKKKKKRGKKKEEEEEEKAEKEEKEEKEKGQVASVIQITFFPEPCEGKMQTREYFSMYLQEI